MHSISVFVGLAFTVCAVICLLGCASGGQRLPTEAALPAISDADATDAPNFWAAANDRSLNRAPYKTLARRTDSRTIRRAAWLSFDRSPAGTVPAATVTPTAWPNAASPPRSLPSQSNTPTSERLPTASPIRGQPTTQLVAYSQPAGPIGAGVSIPWPSQTASDRAAPSPFGVVDSVVPGGSATDGVRWAAGAAPLDSAYTFGEAMPQDLPAEPPLYTPLNPSIERLPPVYDPEWLPQTAPPSDELDNSVGNALAPAQSESGRWWLPYGLPQRAETAGQRLVDYWRQTRTNVVSDHRNYYQWSTAWDLGWAVALAAPLANTSLDEDFHHWYQRDVRSSGSDDLSSFWRPWGEGKIFIPAWAGLAVVGHLWEERPLATAVGRFGDRTTRAYLVGAPPMLLMQFVLGASRPGETSHGSYWKPFDDTNAVSGHAFIGAVPFLTAARMTDRPAIKGALILLSAFPAWSRVNDDRHYLSQVCLGWYMAHLAVRAVDQTEDDRRPIRIVPIANSQMTGLGLVIQR